MDRSRVCKLIAETFAPNQYGVMVPVEAARTVFCNISSVTQSEWFEGSRNGLNPEYRVTMFAPDYAGEQIIEIDGNRYAVYRTYLGKSEMLELYVQRKQGYAKTD